MTGERGLFARSGPLFLVESYWPGVSAARVADADVQTLHFLEQVGDDAVAARHLGSVLVPRDELLLRLFAGGSPDRIKTANERAGVPVERVVEIVALPPRRGQPIGKHPM